jgi:YesN/AraC family two-component response regulator
MKRVLFVDDEPEVLEGLRNLLHKQRREWDMAFVGGGAAALEEMKTAPFDVVVSDVRMPGIDGVELLRRVKDDYPSTARIVLSGHTDPESMRKLSPIANRFLTKPCDSDTLRSAIQRVCELDRADGNCLHSDYLETYRNVRSALEKVDAGALARLRVTIAYRAEKKACMLAFDDAVQGRPPRSRVHLCRMHQSIGCASSCSEAR